MLPRLLFRHIIKPGLVRQSFINFQRFTHCDPSSSSSGAFPSGHATMNDMPQPAGSWKEFYVKRNARNNLILGVSFFIMVGVITAGHNSGVVYYNFNPPRLD